MSNAHSFHIPVMGIGFTIDTPLKVAHLGIDSVISLVDDILIERMRKLYCEKHNLDYSEVTDKHEDHRAIRITEYLNLINTLVNEQFTNMVDAVHTKAEEIKKYFSLLPDHHSLKADFDKMMDENQSITDIKNWLKSKLHLGSIDVNIMTKVDKDNYFRNEKLPKKYNDAHAALRGFAHSELKSALILSAGMNPSLFSYMEEFEDFYPNVNGEIKKRIILKVSDYRSALIQGKILAKKGLWVSEYRIESGLNCGGHAFATDGYLMGPILAEFRDKRQELQSELFSILSNALEQKNKPVPSNLELSISAQGGVGTSDEHQFLLDHYKVDSVGWGTPFLLVPEVANVEEDSLRKLEKAKEEDLFLSNISPLGVPFNSLRGNSKDQEKEQHILDGRPGSPCPKKFVALNHEFNEKGLCTASRQYQHRKIKELESLQLPKDEYQERLNAITVKSCTCVGLGTSALLVNNMDTKIEGKGVSICPGPNMAYFSKQMKLNTLVDHIYGRTNVIERTDRPNMFVKELNIYLDYFKERVNEAQKNASRKQEKYLNKFATNLNEGIEYYEQLTTDFKEKFEELSTTIKEDFKLAKSRLSHLIEEVENIFVPQQ